MKSKDMKKNTKGDKGGGMKDWLGGKKRTVAKFERKGKSRNPKSDIENVSDKKLKAFEKSSEWDGPLDYVIRDEQYGSPITFDERVYRSIAKKGNLKKYIEKHGYDDTRSGDGWMYIGDCAKCDKEVYSDRGNKYYVCWTCHHCWHAECFDKEICAIYKKGKDDVMWKCKYCGGETDILSGKLYAACIVNKMCMYQEKHELWKEEVEKQKERRERLRKEGGGDLKVLLGLEDGDGKENNEEGGDGLTIVP